MATEPQRQYQYLEARPGSNYRQLFLKGRRIRAEVVYHAIHGPDPYTPEEFAENYQVPLEAVFEALDYVARNQSVIQADHDREEASLRARGLLDGPPPTNVGSSANPGGSLSLSARREINAACQAAEMKAVALADSHYPLDRIPADPGEATAYRSEREKVLRDAREEGRREVIERYGIDAARLDAIDQEGRRERWPRWDGLSDERGPIPAFGPARTDESGRISMSDEERAARRDAAIRALAVVGQITDKTDTDEVWDEVSRGLEGAS